MEAEFLKLNDCLNNSEFQEAESIIINITKALSEDIVSSDIDAYIVQIFNECTGLENFIKKSLFKSDFSHAVTKAFELLYMLTNNFFPKLKNRVLALAKLCIYVVIVPSTAAIHKDKFSQLLMLIIDRPEKTFERQEIEKIYKELHSKFKFKDKNTVLGKVVCVLGAICKHYPEIIEVDDELLNLVVTGMEYDVTKYDKNITILTGYFTYLADFFECFNAPDEVHTRLYKCIKIAAEDLTVTIKTAGRAALSLFGRHISKYSRFLVTDSNWWNNVLRTWLSRSGDDQKVAFSTILSFNQELANILRDRNDDEAKALFGKFFEIFYEALDVHSLHGYHLRLAIRGLGIFADAFRTHRTHDQLQNVFIEIVHRMETIFLTDIDTCKRYMDYLPDYLETSSSFLKQFEFVTTAQLTCLERLTILLFRMFPSLSVAHHGLVIDAMLLTLYRLKCSKDDVLDRFLQNVIYQAVIWTCSHQIVPDAEVLMQDSNQDVVTYERYLPLWNGLLTVRPKFAKQHRIKSKQMLLLIVGIYDELMKVLFILINKLNLNTQVIQDSATYLPPELMLQAERVNDFVIFVNVVDLYGDIIERAPGNYFKKWINMYTNQVIDKSVKHPVVSGFYKLLASCLIVCDNLCYFDEERMSKEYVRVTFDSIKRHIEEMVPRMVQYNGDLQLACLKLILVSPMEIINAIPLNFAPIFVTAFTVGRSFLKITELAIDTLEKWHHYWPEEKLDPFLIQVLPTLDSYLRSKSFKGHAEKHTLLTNPSGRKPLKKRRMYAESDAELLNIQKKILVFLSKCNSDLCYEFVNANVHTDPVIWSDRPHLKMVLPFEDGRANIYVETFVPRVLDLALHSSDGRTKMAACELLHSIVMLLLGTSSKMDAKRVEDLNKLLEKIIHAVIKLACDYDIAIRQLYSLLLMQLMHWYSHPRQFKSTQTSIVLTALFDGTVDTVNSDIRNVCGTALHEFVKYTRKQTKESDLKKDAANIEAILRTINSYNVHPDAVKRFAGSLIFNNIYTELREEASIFNMYWVELFYSFIISLSLQNVWTLAEDNCVEEINKSLDHLTRGFVEKCAVFKKHDNNRKTPPSFEKNSLIDVVKCVFHHSSSININCRVKCIRLFEKLAPIAKGNIRSFIDTDVPRKDWFKDFEHELEVLTALAQLGALSTNECILKWCLCLICSLDAHLFAVRNNMIPDDYDYGSSKTFAALKYYFSKVQVSEFKQLCSEQSVQFEIGKKTLFDNLKCLIATKLIELSMKLAPLQRNDTNGVSAFFFEDYYSFVINLVFNFDSLGLHPKIQGESRDDVIKLVQHLKKHLQPEKIMDFSRKCKQFIQDGINSIFNVSNNISCQQRMLVNGMLLLNKSDFASDIKVPYPKIMPILREALFEEQEGQLVINPKSATTVEYLKSLLELAIYSGETDDFVKNVSDDQCVKFAGTNQVKRYGNYLATVFLSTLTELLKDNGDVTAILMSSMMNDDFVTLLLAQLKLMEKSKNDYNNRDIGNLVESVMDNWQLLTGYFNKSAENRLRGIQILHYSESLNKVVLDWYLQTLQKKPKNVDEVSLEYFNGLIPLLHKVADGFLDENDEQHSFKNCLQKVKANYFADLKRPTIITAAKVAILKLVDSFTKSKSTALIAFTLDLYLMYYHEENSFLQQSEAFLLKLVNDSGNEFPIIEVFYSLCNNKDYSLNQMIIAINIFCSLLSHVKMSYFEEFYLEHLENIFDTLDSKSWNKLAVLNKIASFLLMETLFSRVNIETFYTELFGTNTGKDILQKVLKIGLNIWKEELRSDDEDLNSIYQKYYRHAYNTLVSIICGTQTNIEFYYKLAYRDADSKDILWEKIINISKNYNFDDRFDITPERKNIVVKIKAVARIGDQHNVETSKTVKYIESQPLFGSTLCEDITKYDFTNSTVKSLTVMPDNAPLDEEVPQTQNIEIYLEDLEINNHECMAPVCALFQKILDLEKEMPLSKLSKIVKNMIESVTVHNNIKIFLAKVIENLKDSFKSQCEILFVPLANCITFGIFGDNLNFFNMDIVIMLINWYDSNKIVPPRETLSELYLFLITKLECENNRDVFKYNMSVIKVFVELWKGRFDLPYEALSATLKVPITSKKIEVGIQLIAILLSNDIPPWSGSTASIRALASSLSSILANEHSPIYKSCSETIGMCLKSLSSQPDIRDKFVTLVEKNLQLIKRKDKLSYCLEAIMKHYPPISKSFLVTLLYDLDKVRGNFKYIYLRIFLNSIDILHSWRDLENIEFKNQLSEPNVDVQIVSLEFIAKSVSYFSIGQIAPLIKYILGKFPSSSNATCRSIMYDICTAVYERYNESEDELVTELVTLCVNCLLQGLVESDPEIELKVRNFWSKHNKMPREIYSKFVFILENMYTPDIEEHFLAYSIYFLLNALKESDAYNEDIFEYPLHECEYTDFVLRCHWREKHATIAPMFASTLQSQEIDYSVTSMTDFNMLRKTQSQYEFTPTQNHLAMEKEKVLKTYESSLLFSSDSAKEAGEFVDPNNVEISNNYKISNRRFLKDKTQVSRSIALNQVKKGVKRDELRKDLAVQRDKQVNIYRKYRKGEFPDIQIPHSALIAPLVVLCKYDSQIARHLFVKLFTDVVARQAPEDCTEAISKIISEVLNRSTEYTQHVMGTFLDIAISQKDFIQFSPHIITKVCINSGLMSMGCLLLEEYLNQGIDTPAKIGVSTDTEITFWTSLATLYKELEETDIVRAIFLAKMNCKENVLDALDAEAQNNYSAAIPLFMNIISEEFSEDRRDFYYESYFRCFAELSKWEDLSNTIIKSIEDAPDLKSAWKGLWDKDFNQEKLLPWLMKSEMHNIVKNDDRKNEFLACINEALLDTDRVEYLKSIFSEQMAFLWILNDDPDRSLCYLNSYISQFLNNWCDMNPLFSVLRRNIIVRHRNAMDIFSFIQILKELSTDNYEDSIETMLSSWERSSLEIVPSIILNETRNMYRTSLLTMLSRKVGDFFKIDDQIHEAKGCLKQTKFMLDLNLINCALSQDNLHIAKKYIQNKKDYMKRADSSEGQQAILAYSKTLLLKANIVTDAEDQINLLQQAWSRIAKLTENPNIFEDPVLRLNFSEQTFQITSQIFNIIDCNQDLDTSALTTTLQQYVGDCKDLRSYTDLKTYGREQLSNNLQYCETTLQTSRSMKLIKAIAKAYVSLAYCSMKSEPIMERETVYCVLKSMYYESREGCQLFPCLLNLKSLAEHSSTNEITDIFQIETNKIPPWMFIQWIPQLLANVDSVKARYIDNIVLKIAKMYPDAIMYPYRLSKEKYKLKDAAIKQHCEHLIHQLDALLLGKPKIDKFLESFSSLTSPENLLIDYVTELNKWTQDKTTFFEMCEGIINELFSGKYSLRDSESSRGMIFKGIEKFKADFSSLHKGKYDFSSVKSKLFKLYEKIKTDFKTKSSKLKDYSPWMHNFATFKDDFEIEIPGQYSGYGKPLPQYHVKICGFSPEVKKYSSLREPIQITILGNDSKEYPFLIKYGEDLRQDQRIEQLFVLINDILKCDPNCSQRKLSILTYQVIPLTSHLGMIQWVRETETLGNVLLEALPPEAAKSFDTARAKYNSWIKKCSKSAKVTDQYREMNLTKSRDDVIPFYRSVVNEIPWDILRRAFQRRSTNTESYYVLRSAFCASYAVMGVAHWLLGIGDRHQENAKVALASGEVVGVDFGHAFGSATELLAVPELVPLRLTPHIINLMQPLSEHGLLQETMIHTLRALRANPDSLLATLDVFVREPSVDWLESARQANIHDGITGEDDVDQLAWYPMEKVVRVRHKLVAGANPRWVTAQEIAARGARDDVKLRERLEALVRGQPATDLRARMPDTGLTPEEQIRCLIDQATDYNLLGRMYSGWESWV